MQHRNTCIVVAITTIFVTCYTVQYLKSINYMSLRGFQESINDEEVIEAIYEGKCYHGSYKGVLLLLNFNFPYYDNIPLLKELYEGVFERIVFCGPPSNLKFGLKPDLIIEEQYGHKSYQCMALAMMKYPGYQGYLFGNDDMVINWWTMVNEDRRKIWHGTKVVDWRQQAFGKVIESRWIWWKSYMGIKACKNYYSVLKSLAENPLQNSSIYLKQSLDIYLQNSNGEPRCGKGWADFYYVPGFYSKQFIELSGIAYNSQLFHEIAVHNILRSLDLIANIVVVNGIYLPDVTGTMEYTNEYFWTNYQHGVAFIHPYKFHGPKRYESINKLKDHVIRFKDKLITCFKVNSNTNATNEHRD